MPDNTIERLFQERFGEPYKKCEPLPHSGSNRRYYRLTASDGTTVLAVHNDDATENKAYLSFTQTFTDCGINVPTVFSHDDTMRYYLVEDIGRETLYDLVTAADGNPDSELIKLFSKVLDDLAKIQISAGRKIDYSLCIGSQNFDQTAIQWDLNYFKYCYLKNAHINFDEQKLETDFETIKQAVAGTDNQYFMFRDFQSRNIMLKNGTPYYIDFQGGKHGPLAYDVASLLYQAKAKLSEETRNLLFDKYLESVKKLIDIDTAQLKREFKIFALIRTLQVLGAYGYRGYYEKKQHFIESIPFALKNLKNLLALNILPLPHLCEIADKIEIEEPEKDDYNGLTVTVVSFSYKKGIPTDAETGGGFVFDCRGQHNPGRYDEYKMLTGRDQPVIDFLKSNSTIDHFLSQAIDIVTPTIEKYIERGFTKLMVCFGCTGGQHRSAYCAQNFAEAISKKHNVCVKLIHRELKINQIFNPSIS